MDLSKTEDDFSIIERLAEAIRLEEDMNISPEQQSKIVKDLYEGPKKCQCCVNWIEECPHGVDLTKIERPSDDEGTHPLVIRRRVTPGAGGTRVDIHSIDVRHAGVRQVLAEVFKGFDGIVPDIKFLIFLAPFKQFFYRWEAFEKAIAEETNEEIRNILFTLRTVVKRELAEAFAVSKELIGHGVITSRFLWTLFIPGDLIYSEDNEDPWFFVLRDAHTARHNSFSLSMDYVSFDGYEFGTNSRNISIYWFSGTMPITSLAAFPAKYLPNFKEVQASLVERGRKFASLAGFHYKAYREVGKPSRGRSRSSSDDQVDRRIILDPKSHPHHYYIRLLLDENELACETQLILQAPLDLPPPGGHKPLPPPRRDFNTGVVAQPYTSWSDDDFEVEPRVIRKKGIRPPRRARSPVVIETVSRHTTIRRELSPGAHDTACSVLSMTEEERLEKARGELTDFHLQLCAAEVQGYCLKQKTWRYFKVDGICDIEWNTEPFESLVLPDGYKDLILAFVESQIKDGETFDDVINGKGGGLVILLAGDPGVGKTLTAESVAEKIRAPLFKMELGEYKDDRVRRDYGSDAGSDTEENDFVTAFGLAAKWGAVLLIDECDLYLEKRSDGSSKRNRMVSRFLRELEYYPSLLFLTTNRERVLDPAVYSRIHLTINYPALDEPSRRKIWKTFLSHKSESSVDEAELSTLARIDLNGRRIRNIVKTARIMAKREERPTCFDDIRKVMRITEGFTIVKGSVG